MNRFACLMSLTFARAPLVLAAALCSIANVFAPAAAWVAAAVALLVLSALTDLFASIDGAALGNLANYRAMSDMFTFTADPAATSLDPCITGTPQPGVAAGYWLLLAPLPPGQHTLHFGAPSWSQDITYVLTVKSWRGNH